VTNNDDNDLLILWTTGDRETAVNMVFMYARNSKINRWWKNVTVLIWGASTKAAAGDRRIRQQIASLKNQGVRVMACKKCAENVDVVEELEKQGVEVFYSGRFLTDWLKSGKKLLTI